MTIPRNLSFLAQGASSTGVLSVPYGGTGLTTLTAGYIPYGNGTGAFNSGSSLQYTSNGNGFSLAVASGGTWPEFSYQSSINLGNSGYGTFTARGGTTLFGSNFYVNSGGGYSYKNTDYASFLQFTNGQVQFITGPSGTAGTSISASQPMTVFPSGGVSIGNTTDPGAANLSVNTQLFVNTTTSPSNTNSGNSYSSLGQIVMESINAISVGTTAVQITKNGGFGGMAFITANQGGYNYNAVVIWSANGTVTVVSSNGTLGYLQVVNYSLGGPYNGQLFMSVSGISGGNLTVNGIAFTTNRA